MKSAFHLSSNFYLTCVCKQCAVEEVRLCVCYQLYVHICLLEFFLTQSKEALRMNKQEMKQGPEARHLSVHYLLRINGETITGEVIKIISLLYQNDALSLKASLFQNRMVALFKIGCAKPVNEDSDSEEQTYNNQGNPVFVRCNRFPEAKGYRFSVLSIQAYVYF